MLNELLNYCDINIVYKKWFNEEEGCFEFDNKKLVVINDNIINVNDFEFDNSEVYVLIMDENCEYSGSEGIIKKDDRYYYIDMIIEFVIVEMSEK